MLQKKNKISIIIFYIFILFFLSTINNKSLTLATSNFFKIKKIKISGVNEDIKNDIYIQINKSNEINNINSNKQNLDKVLRNNTIIDDYIIKKKFPSTLIIYLKQTSLIASYFKNGKKYYLGSNGKEILAEKYHINADTPVIYGNFNSENFLELTSHFNKNNIYIGDIKQFYYFENKRWDFKTKDGILVKLPRDNLENVLKLCFYLLTKDKNKKIIDLRVSNQVIMSNE
mgnify:CR=1 FL=1